MDDYSGVSSQAESQPGPLKPKRQRSLAQRVWDRERSKTRVNIGLAFPRWRALKAKKEFQLDADVALFLLDEYEKGPAARTPSETTGVQVPAAASSSIGASAPEWEAQVLEEGFARLGETTLEASEVTGLQDSYLRTESESRPDWQKLKRSSSTETCESVHYEYPIMSSPNEAEWEIGSAPSVQSSVEEEESGYTDEAWRLKGQNEWTTKQPEKKENTVKRIHTDIKEEFRTSLSVRDGFYVVDLGSSSEFIVDEECILQLFRSCRECNSRCKVKKRAKGLKLVVYQTCCFCQSHCKWTNLLGDDNDKEDGDFQTNGKDEAHMQPNTAVLPNSNRS